MLFNRPPTPPPPPPPRASGSGYGLLQSASGLSRGNLAMQQMPTYKAVCGPAGADSEQAGLSVPAFFQALNVVFLHETYLLTLRQLAFGGRSQSGQVCSKLSGPGGLTIAANSILFVFDSR